MPLHTYKYSKERGDLTIYVHTKKRSDLLGLSGSGLMPGIRTLSSYILTWNVWIPLVWPPSANDKLTSRITFNCLAP